MLRVGGKSDACMMLHQDPLDCHQVVSTENHLNSAHFQTTCPNPFVLPDSEPHWFSGSRNMGVRLQSREGSGAMPMSKLFNLVLLKS
jgi:hypothetical protein